MSVNVKTVLAANIKTRWREPFASEALNKRGLGVNPPGAYRGLLMATPSPPADLTVTVTADSIAGDHIALAETSNGFSVGYINDGGDFDIDLSDASLLSTDVVIVLKLLYSVGADTTGVFIAYPLAEYDALSASAKAELVVLGTVSVPASGVIPAASITSTRRSLPYLRRAAGAVAWTPLVRNGSFDAGDTANGIPRGILYWHRSESSAYDWDYSTTDAVSSGQSLGLTVNTSGVPFSAIMRHRIGSEVPEVPGDRRVKFSFQKKQLIVPTAGTVDIVAIFKDAAGVGVETTVLTLDVTGVDASFVEIETTIPIPTGMVIFDSVRISFDLTNFPSTGEAFLFDDFQVWLEPDLASAQPELSRQGAMVDANVINVRGESAEKPFSTAYAEIDFNGLNLTIKNPNTVGTVGVDHDYAVLGTRSIGSIANAEIPRVQAPASVFAGVEYTLMWESVPSGQAGYRFYVGADGATVRTFNAVYDNTTNLWSQDVTTVDTQATYEGPSGVTIKRKFENAADWLETAWDLVRVVVDHLGYRTGRISEIRAEWLAATDPYGWVSASSLAASVTIEPDGSVFEGPSVKMLMSGGAGSNSMISDLSLAYPSSDKVWVIESEVYFTDIIGVGGTLGFLKITGNTSGAYFSYLPSASSFWRLYTFDNANVGSPEITPTTVSPVNNTPQRLRLEMYGSGLPGGAKVRAYIDGVLAAESTVKQPDNPMDLIFSSANDGAAGTSTYTVGPLTAWYNRVLKDDVL